VELEIFVGTSKTFALTVIDPDTGTAKDLTSVTTFDTGNFKILKPDGTNIVTVAITYADRANGLVTFVILSATTILANAGNWIGELELLNTSSDTVDQQKVNFNILESF